MRPTLTVLDPDLVGRIVDEAKRILAEVRLEIREPSSAGDVEAHARWRNRRRKG